ncbi:hypothetical protein LXA43DRAFT_1066508 [Ganoderma leucocontextum]|nr:hypothetical protein LXA43DRAFT_1066508 [Ganoderma leucocontextum]
MARPVNKRIATPETSRALKGNSDDNRSFLIDLQSSDLCLGEGQKGGSFGSVLETCDVEALHAEALGRPTKRCMDATFIVTLSTGCALALTQRPDMVESHPMPTEVTDEESEDNDFYNGYGEAKLGSCELEPLLRTLASGIVVKYRIAVVEAGQSQILCGLWEKTHK